MFHNVYGTLQNFKPVRNRNVPIPQDAGKKTHISVYATVIVMLKLNSQVDHQR